MFLPVFLRLIKSVEFDDEMEIMWIVGKLQQHNQSHNIIYPPSSEVKLATEATTAPPRLRRKNFCATNIIF